MIFFIISKQNLDPKIPRPDSPIDKEWGGLMAGATLIAWSEVYGNIVAFCMAVREAAMDDPVCRGMVVRFREEFGLDVLGSSDTVVDLWDDVMNRWCTPLTGNMFNSPNPRPMTRTGQLGAAAGRVSPKTIEAMTLLDDEQPDRAWRDQSRVFLNITVAARAIVGEITCAVIKRAEKVLAFRLCRSEMLHAKQCAAINLYLRMRGAMLDKAVLAKPPEYLIKSFQYSDYYLPEMKALTTPCGYVVMLHRLLSIAIGEAYPPPPLLPKPPAGDLAIVERSAILWARLPPTMQCTILINDITRVDRINVKDASREFPRIMVVGENVHKIFFEGRPPVYLPAVADHITGWTRNEYSETEINYRLNLCPLWAGASGHVIGNVKQWYAALGKHAPIDLAQTIACGLFAFWRVYYDKRISSVHSIAECFEGTFYRETPVAWPKQWRAVVWKQPVETDDAWFVVARCKVVTDSALAIDPIMLVENVCLWLWPGQGFELSYGLLKREINIERTLLTERYNWHVPRWSHDTTTNTGIAVVSYHPERDEISLKPESFTEKKEEKKRVDAPSFFSSSPTATPVATSSSSYVNLKSAAALSSPDRCPTCNQILLLGFCSVCQKKY